MVWGVWIFERKIIKYYVLGEDLLGNNADFASLDESLSSLTEAFTFLPNIPPSSHFEVTPKSWTGY